MYSIKNLGQGQSLRKRKESKENPNLTRDILKTLSFAGRNYLIFPVKQFDNNLDLI